MMRTRAGSVAGAVRFAARRLARARGAGQDAVRSYGAAQSRGPAGTDAPEPRRRLSKRGDRRLGQAPPRARDPRVLRRLGLHLRCATHGLFSSTVRDRRRTEQRATSGAVLGQHDPGQHQALFAWQLSLRELQAPAAIPRRVLLSVQPLGSRCARCFPGSPMSPCELSQSPSESSSWLRIVRSQAA